CARPVARPTARRLRPPPGRMRRGRTVPGAASRGDRGASWTPARGEGDGGGRVLRAPAAVPSPPQQEGQEAQADDHGDLYEGIVVPDAARLPAGEGAGGDERRQGHQAVGGPEPDAERDDHEPRDEGSGVKAPPQQRELATA